MKTSRREKPNILFICTDQQRYDSIGCYGVDCIDTPNLDRLADEGIVFENCYANNPICTPSRASMFTGKYLPGHGVYKLHDILPKEEVLFTELLKKAGYTTALFGKLHVSGRIYEEKYRHPNDGFDIYEWCLEASVSMDSPYNHYSRWLKNKNPEFHERLKTLRRKLLHIPVEYHMTHWAAERTIDFIKNYNGEKPFFCMMSVFDPHNPYDDYPIEIEDRVKKEKIPEPIYLTEEQIKSTPRIIDRERKEGYLGVFDQFTNKEIMEMRKGYFASVALIDLEVGRVLEVLEEKDLKDNTAIIFTSDHGDMLGDHNLFVKGAYFYDPCVKVPLIFNLPKKLKARKRVKELVQLNDLAGTILNLAGYDDRNIKRLIPDSLNIIKIAEGKVKREYAVCLYRNSGIDRRGEPFDPPIHATMLRDDRFKMTIYHKSTGLEYPQGELYDLKEDPFELENLWDDPGYIQVKLRLKLELIEWLHIHELLLGSRGGEARPSEDQKIVNIIK